MLGGTTPEALRSVLQPMLSPAEAGTRLLDAASALFNALETWTHVRRRGCASINAYAELDDRDHPAVPVIRAEKGLNARPVRHPDRRPGGGCFAR